MSECVQRINGALMGNFVGSKAVIVAFVQKIDSSGTRGTFKTTDNLFIQVSFISEVSFPLEQGALVRLYGNINSKNQFQCESFAHYSKEIGEKFDVNSYETFVKLYPNFVDRIVVN